MRNGQRLTLNRKHKLISELNDPEYRQAFVEGHAKDTIAFQLRMLRKKKGWDQRDVAKALGNFKLQPMISRYENPDYGRYSIATLLSLASVFDVALVVRFAPFSEVVDWDLSSNEATLCPASFKEDQRLAHISQIGPTLDEDINASVINALPEPGNGEFSTRLRMQKETPFIPSHRGGTYAALSNFAGKDNRVPTGTTG